MPFANFNQIAPYAASAGGATGGGGLSAGQRNQAGTGISGVFGGAVGATKRAIDQLGIPKWSDMLKAVTGNTDIQFGRGGLAETGAATARGDAMRFDDLEKGAMAGFANPRGTRAFKDMYGLAQERTASAADTSNRQAAEAASRRGFAGGYDPEEVGRDRMKALAETGFAASDAVRQEQLDAAKMYAGQEQGAESAWAGLTQTAAELPTKYLSALMPLLTGGGGFGSLLSDALQGAEFDVTNPQSQRALAFEQQDKMRQEAEDKRRYEQNRQDQLKQTAQQRQDRISPPGQVYNPAAGRYQPVTTRGGF